MKTITTLLLFFISLPIIAQDSTKTKTLKTIDQLEFMKGTWKGDGWIIMRDGKKTFTQTETISSKVNNTLLMIDGIGYEKDSTATKPKVIHNAFGVISFNPEKKAITMLSYSTTGGKMENEMQLIGDKKLEWSFKSENGGVVRFREDFTNPNLWIEKGDYSANGETWFPFFEMRLIKQE